MEKNLKTNNRISYFGADYNISKIELGNLEIFTQIEDEIWVDSSGNFHINQINDLRFIKENLEEASEKLKGKGVIVIKGLKGTLLSITIGKCDGFIYSNDEPDCTDILIRFGWTVVYDLLMNNVGKQHQNVVKWIENDVLAIIELNKEEIEKLRMSIEKEGIRKIIRLTPKL